MNGGARTDHWPEGFQQISDLSTSAPEIPLILLPSTIRFHGTDFQEIVARHQATVHLFAREDYTLKRLEAQKWPSHVILHRDHDMAFALANTKEIQILGGTKPNDSILVVERGDREAVTGKKEETFGPPATRLIPAVIKRPLKSWLIRRNSRYTPLVAEVRRWKEQYSDRVGEKIDSMDVSRPDALSYERFKAEIAAAGCLVSTRLHAGILAAMLGRETYLVPSEVSLGKIQGVFEQTMRDWPNVNMWPPDGLRPPRE